MLAKTPKPPYYAVIFSAAQSANLDGYDDMVAKMVELASQQNGFLGVDSAQGNPEITVSYWKSEEDILNWRSSIEHQEAQKQGKESWYDAFEIRIAKVARAYSFQK
ncbi:MAG: antibiotic biosynthesis monooxygenase [Crocinitomicaceae bacterium]|nr:antibiotic biosynthesis monooxygenase [Crocinitomicaceae bacterium]